ncbi:M56 family metallopeptidase [Streptomyces sodiiphilus]|uniref:M56 family metallopeptidase n=1 Tax=Streptomyces sodiiphilus TaxID=226217 RepID=A0ABN2NX47_9ACTN
MAHHLLLPLGTALGTGVLGPVLLARIRWPQQAPRLAVSLWLLLACTFVVAGWLTLAELLRVAGRAPEPLGAVLACSPWGTGSLLLALAFVLPGSALVRELLRTRRTRSRHRAALRLVGRKSPEVPATVLDSATPAVYCLPGLSPQIVVSTGALSALTPGQLRAALEHERAHLTGRHHLLVSAARACAVTIPGLPLARRLREDIPLLLEMVADDRAMRRCPPEELATALYRTATAGPPPGAFGLGGSFVLLRLRRILTPSRRFPGLLCGASTLTCAVLVGAALLGTCCTPSA